MTKTLAAALLAAPGAGLLDHDAPHRLRRRREEMPAAVPTLRPLRPRHPQVRFMHQRRRLERLPRLLLRQPLRRQLPQLIVHQRQEAFRWLLLTALDPLEDHGDIPGVHGPE